MPGVIIWERVMEVSGDTSRLAAADLNQGSEKADGS